MKTLALATLMLAGLSAHAGTPPTLSCQLGYIYGDGPADIDDLPKIEVALQKSRELPRYVADVEQSTTDGRFRAHMRALQPLAGDVFTESRISIYVTDIKTQLVFLSQDAIGLSKHHATIMTVGEGHPYVSVDCELK